MKKFFFNVSMVFCMAGVVALASCDKNEGNGNPGDDTLFSIKVVVENGRDYSENITDIKAQIPLYEIDSVLVEGENRSSLTVNRTFAGTLYSKSEFTINLPNLIVPKYLLNLFEMFEFYVVKTISDPTVKLVSLFSLAVSYEYD